MTSTSIGSSSLNGGADRVAVARYRMELVLGWSSPVLPASSCLSRFSSLGAPCLHPRLCGVAGRPTRDNPDQRTKPFNSHKQVFLVQGKSNRRFSWPWHRISRCPFSHKPPRPEEEVEGKQARRSHQGRIAPQQPIYRIEAIEAITSPTSSGRDCHDAKVMYMDARLRRHDSSTTSRWRPARQTAGAWRAVSSPSRSSAVNRGVRLPSSSTVRCGSRTGSGQDRSRGQLIDLAKACESPFRRLCLHAHQLKWGRSYYGEVQARENVMIH